MTVAATDSRPYHHGDLHNACVRAALELLEAEGLEAVTLRGVAERAGVSRSAPYRHFSDKRALLDRVSGCWRRRFSAPIRRLGRTRRIGCGPGAAPMLASAPPIPAFTG